MGAELMDTQLRRPDPVTAEEKSSDDYKRIKIGIMQMVEERVGVSFVELWEIEGTRGPIQMDLRVNLTVMAGLSRFAVEAIKDLLDERRIIIKTCSLLVYYVDGALLSMPIAKKIRDYKVPHWLPSTLDLPAGQRVKVGV